MTDRPAIRLFDAAILRRAALESFRKLDPRHQLRNPVMFTVLVGSVFTTGLAVQAIARRGEEHPGFVLAIAAWLWFTLLFANFAEAIAEGRGQAQADALRRARTEVMAKKLDDPQDHLSLQVVPATTLRVGDQIGRAHV